MSKNKKNFKELENEITLLDMTTWFKENNSTTEPKEQLSS